MYFCRPKVRYFLYSPHISWCRRSHKRRRNLLVIWRKISVTFFIFNIDFSNKLFCSLFLKSKICLQFQHWVLNAVTKLDAYPILNIVDTLDSLGHSKLFTVLDMASGYHQISIKQKQRENCIFMTSMRFTKKGSQFTALQLLHTQTPSWHNFYTCHHQTSKIMMDTRQDTLRRHRWTHP